MYKTEWFLNQPNQQNVKMLQHDVRAFNLRFVYTWYALCMYVCAMCIVNSACVSLQFIALSVCSELRCRKKNCIESKKDRKRKEN